MKTFKDYYDDLAMRCQVATSNYLPAFNNPSAYTSEEYGKLKREWQTTIGEHSSFMWQVMKFGIKPEDEFDTYC